MLPLPPPTTITLKTSIVKQIKNFCYFIRSNIIVILFHISTFFASRITSLAQGRLLVFATEVAIPASQKFSKESTLLGVADSVIIVHTGL